MSPVEGTDRSVIIGSELTQVPPCARLPFIKQ
jgi:hypothetical protein